MSYRLPLLWAVIMRSDAYPDREVEGSTLVAHSVSGTQRMDSGTFG